MSSSPKKQQPPSDTQGNKGQSGPQRIQSDTMNSSPRQSAGGRTSDKSGQQKPAKSGKAASRH